MRDHRRIPNDELVHLAKREEPRLLNILLRDKDSLMECIAFGIEPEHFWDDSNRFLYKVIIDNFKRYNSLLTRSAMDSFMDMQSSYTDEQRSARKIYWDQIYSSEFVSEDFEMLKNGINGRFVQQQAYDVLIDNTEKVVGATTKQVELVRDIRQKFMGIEGVDADQYALTMGIKEGMDQAMNHIIDRREHPENASGVLMGLKGLDEIFYGLLPSSYTIISGMTNGGKTTLMFNIAFNMAKAGYSVVYASLEKEAVLFYLRLLCLHSMVDYNRVKKGGKESHGLPDHIFELLIRGKSDLDDDIKPKFECIQLAQGTKLSKIISEVERIKARKKVDVLVVDYLGVIGFESHHPTRPDLDLAEVSQRLQAYGRINRFVTITAVQLKASSTKEIRKKAEKVGDDGDISSVEINSEDLAGSQKIIHDADNSMGVILNADKPATKMFINITKARDNEKGRTIQFDFDGRTGRVSDPEHAPGQIQAVDDLLYNSDITEEQLASEDDLFRAVEGSIDGRTDDKTNTTSTELDLGEDLDGDLLGDLNKASSEQDDSDFMGDIDYSDD